jgi:hypothetical protein
MMFPELFKHSKRKNRSVADALLNDNWISDVAHDLSPALMAQYIMLWILVDAVHFDREDTAEDEIVWRMTADGAYSARSAYALQFEGSKLSAFTSMVWRVWAPARRKFWMWLMLQNRIWTAARLLLREWPNKYFCPLCCRNLETASHLFQECPLSLQIWTEMSNWAKVPGFHPSSWSRNKVMEDWFSELASGINLSKAHAKGVRSLTILIRWTVWKDRNARIFEGRERLPSVLVFEIKSEATLWCRAGNKALARVLGVSCSE